MIAQRIYHGETAEQLGITAVAFVSRKATLDRYLAQSGGKFIPNAYLQWLQEDQAGQRGEDPPQTSQAPPGRAPAARVGVRIVTPKPCNSCGGGLIR
jgi:hypothetical protein